jgi:hypothetical protein
MVVVNTLEEARDIEDADTIWQKLQLSNHLVDSISWLERSSSTSEEVVTVNVAFDWSDGNYIPDISSRLSITVEEFIKIWLQLVKSSFGGSIVLLQSHTTLSVAFNSILPFEVIVELLYVFIRLIVVLSSPPFSLEHWSIWWIGGNLDSGVGFLILFNVEENSHGFGLESLHSWGCPFITYLLGLVILFVHDVRVLFTHAFKIALFIFQLFDGLT